MKRLLVLSAIILFGLSSFGQIIYTDLEPDSVYTDWDVYIFQFDTNYGGDTGAYYIWKHPTDIALNAYYVGCQTLCDANGYPLALEKWDPINQQAGTWRNTQFAYHILNDGTDGNWINKTDHYLGLRFRVGTDFYYGWVNLDIDAGPTYLKVKSYAHESSPNNTILAGQNGLSGIHDKVQKEVRFYIAGKTLHIQGDEIPNNLKIQVYDLTGKNVLKGSVQNSGFSLHQLNEGIYIIKLINDRVSITEKVFIP